MAKHLRGQQVEDFVDAVERATAELDEALALATMNRATTDAEWRSRYIVTAETFARLSLAIADMATIATGNRLAGLRHEISKLQG